MLVYLFVLLVVDGQSSIVGGTQAESSYATQGNGLLFELVNVDALQGVRGRRGDRRGRTVRARADLKHRKLKRK